MSATLTGFSVLLAVICGQRLLVASQKLEPCLIRPEGYKAQEIPVTPKGSPPFTVRVDIAIWSITEVSLERQHMEVDLILTAQWIDNRLTVRPNVSSSTNWVGIGKEIDDLWSPTFTFLNCKGCSPITFKSNSHIPVYVHKKKGTLWTEVRILRRFGCNIQLEFYPMDIQNCPLQIYTGEDGVEAIVLKHYSGEGKRKIDSNVTLSEFAPPSIHTGDCTDSAARTNGYSCLELRVSVGRLLGYHMTTSYLPTSFIVVLSWISFWLPADVIPARIALGLTSLLTLATRLDQAQKNLPAVSYAKAIDVWMLACIFLVSMSLLEFAVCNYVMRKGIGCCKRKKKKRLVYHKYPTTIKIRKISAHHRKIIPLQYEEANMTGNQQDGMLCDKVSRVLFPASFIVFNLVYWNYYMYSSPP